MEFWAVEESNLLWPKPILLQRITITNRITCPEERGSLKYLDRIDSNYFIMYLIEHMEDKDF